MPEVDAAGCVRCRGLVSTIDDYLAFGQMMLNQGKHGRERILSRPSVETMTTDQLTPAQQAASGGFAEYWDSHGWGFGVSVVTRRDDLSAVPWRYPHIGPAHAAAQCRGCGPSWASHFHFTPDCGDDEFSVVAF